MRSRTYALVTALALSLAACDGGDGGPATPSTYGNPELRLPPPVIHFPASVRLVSAFPVSGSVLRVGQTVEAVVEFSLPPEAYPGTAWLQLAAGRVGFTCGYMELTTWSGLGVSVRQSCRFEVGWLLDGYGEYGQGKPLVLNFAVFGPGESPERYYLYRELPLTYTVQP